MMVAVRFVYDERKVEELSPEEKEVGCDCDVSFVERSIILVFYLLPALSASSYSIIKNKNRRLESEPKEV
jgi:hypothetical protein